MQILILGAGLMARGAACDLLKNPAVTTLTVADASDSALATFRERLPGAKHNQDSRIRTQRCDVRDGEQVSTLMREADGVLCAIHYGFNLAFAQIAIATRTHMVDLGGNNDVVAAQRALSGDARRYGISIIPDCGLAPGMVSMLTAWGLQRFPWADTVRIRVGGLPLEPLEPFLYERLFSVEGLINEYVEPPVLLRDGEVVTGQPLGDVECVEFASPVGTLEAFNTSGGTSTLPETFRSRLKNLDYKTLRYPGHARAMQWLYHLGLFSSDPVAINGHTVVPRHLVAECIAATVPLCQKDRTVVRVEFAGTESGHPRTHRLEIIDEYDPVNGLTSMMRMTAFPAAIVLQMQCDGRIQTKGVIPQEIAVDADEFIRELTQRGIRIAGI